MQQNLSKVDTSQEKEIEFKALFSGVDSVA